MYKIIGLCVLAYFAYLLFGNMLAYSIHSVERGVATFFGYYQDPIRPVSENSLIKDLKRENASLKHLLGRDVTIDEYEVLVS